NKVVDGAWEGGRKPLLHYEWMGAAFQHADGSPNFSYIQERMTAIRKRCEIMMERISGSVTPKFDCNKDITFNVGALAIEPLGK
ncbi:hypothetical protein, partial [Escherichia coli]|uniref:hypothetical protein n=1 Tax=Escherichia coli TaxID=562 RepID=UPI0028DFE089